MSEEEHGKGYFQKYGRPGWEKEGLVVCNRGGIIWGGSKIGEDPYVIVVGLWEILMQQRIICSTEIDLTLNWTSFDNDNR